MKVYLAAKFERKMEMRGIRDRLVANGHEVTSQWIDVEHTEDHNVQVTDEMRVNYAHMDIDDVLRADVLIAFSHPRSEPGIGGGRHVEFGVALQSGTPIIVVGPKGEHIFHYITDVEHVADVDALIGHLISLSTEGKYERGCE